jgi:hypothetical protein
MTPNEWKAKVLDLHKFLRDLVYETRSVLTAFPQIIPPQERLDLLVDLRDAWEMESEALTADPILGLRNTAHGWFSPGTQASMVDLVGLFALNLSAMIANDLRAGASHPSLIRTADFKDGVSFRQVPGDAFKVVALGRIEDLPPDHPVLGLGIRYFKTTTGPHLVLGAASGMANAIPGSPNAPKAKPFYDVAGCRHMTEQWATQQARGEEYERQERERQEAFRRAARAHDPIARLQDQVDELKRQLAERPVAAQGV